MHNSFNCPLVFSSLLSSGLSDAEEIRKIKYIEKACCKKTRLKILSYEKVLSNAVKKHFDKLLNEVDQKWEDFAKSINKEEKKVYETCQNLIKEKDQPTIKLAHVNTEFVPGDRSIIPKLVGSLNSVTYPDNPLPMVIQQYSTDVRRCNNIIACPDGKSFWINDKGFKKLQKVKPTGEVMKVISNFDIGVNDLLLMPNGDLLLCLVSNQSILKVIPVGTVEVIDSQYNVSPLLANCVHVNQDKIMIGVKDNGPLFPASGPRQVIVMDHTGKQDQVFQYDNQNRPLFAVPACIHSNKSNTIGVIDWINEDCEGRIVVLNQEGVLKNIYTGHHKINSNNNPFKPSDISSLPSDNFIITEPTNH
ncbi:unnamed protein product [Mytilus coruscus]|uniref:TRIM71 n=1 Tax=Mytilus coruscus TaxID=42192 RepID=A0A6J7ZYP0_MYTCO|nr:unnamed protein product [Mytilus coruscus]